MELIFNPMLAPLLSRRIRRWLTRMGAGLDSGRFRYCREGSLVPVSGHAGLVSTVFAAKILYTTGNWQYLDATAKSDMLAFIASFQSADGFFRDPWMLDALKNSGSSSDAVERYIRAETRQALSLLFALEAAPVYPSPLELKGADHARHYMRELDWRNPWGAVSHFSHQCFFLAAARATGRAVPADIVEALLEELFSHYDPESVTWHINGQPVATPTLTINGLMKMLTGFAWLDSEVYTRLKLDALWERVCEHVAQTDACSLFNHLYVLATISRLQNFKKTKTLEKFCTSYLASLVPFYRWAEGAFSFFPQRSQETYLEAKITSGSSCADLHGTVMQTWALSLLFQLMGTDSCWQPQKV